MIGNFNQKGITIIEALLTMSFITTGLIPLLSLATLSVEMSSRVKNNLIAANLAQEGIEVVRALRDENWFRGNSFSNGLIGTWRVQWNSNWSSSPPLTVGSNPALNIDASGLYTYAAGTTTGFTRTVTITEVVPGTELKVISTVEWPTRYTKSGCPAGKGCLTLELHLLNWK